MAVRATLQLHDQLPAVGWHWEDGGGDWAKVVALITYWEVAYMGILKEQ